MTRLAWGLAALAWAAILAAPIVAVAAGVPRGDAFVDFVDIGLVFSLCFPALGALVVRQRSAPAVGWLMIFMGVAIAIHTFVDVWARTALITVPGSLPFGSFLSWIMIWLWLPGWVLATTLLPALFPDGRPRGRRRLLAWIDGLAVAAITLTTAALAWPMRGRGAYLEPDQVPPDLEPAFDLLNQAYVGGLAITIVLTLVSVGSLLVRFRRAEAGVRRQIAWFVYGATLAVAVSCIGAIRSVGNYVQVLEAVALVGGIAIAMFRYNLYDIAVVVNRTLVYGGLTAILAGAYLVSVLLLQVLLSPSSDLAIAGSTLAVAALFRPARARVQALVDRRFYRRKYDAQRTLDAFSIRLRDEVALDALGAELRGVVSETMQPAHVSLWLRPRP